MLKQRLLPLVQSPRKTATMLMLRSSRRSGVAPPASPRPHTAGRGADFCSTTHPREISPLRRPCAAPTRAAIRAERCAQNTTTSPTRLSPPPPCAGRWSGRPGAAASRPGTILYLRRLIAVLLRAVHRTWAVRPDRRRRATFRRPGAGPTRAAVRAGRCAQNTTTSPTRLSPPAGPPPTCAGRRSGRPGAAASRPGATLYLPRLIAVLLRAVHRTWAVRPDRRRRATFRWPLCALTSPK